MKYLLLLFTSFLVSCSAILQQQGTKSYKPPVQEKAAYKRYNGYQKDFLQLAAICQEGFPLIDSYFPADERSRLKEQIIARLGKADVNEKIFTVEARKYLAHFDNQHTNVYTNTRFVNFFPFEVYNHYNDWYLLNVSRENDSTLIGKKIVSLNRQPVSSFMEKTSEYVFAENEISSRKGVVSNQIYNKSDFLKLAGLIPQSDSLLVEVEDQPPFWIRSVKREQKVRFYEVKAKSHPITNRKSRFFDYQVLADSRLAYFQLTKFNDKDEMLEMVGTYVRGWLQPFARAYLKNQFKKQEPSSTVRHWYDPQRPSLKKYLSKLMNELDSLKIQHLIIDLRHNPGGNILLAKQLLYHLGGKDELQDFHHYFYPSGLTRLFQPHEYENFERSYIQKHKQKPAARQLYPFSAVQNASSDFFKRIKDPASIYYIAPERKLFKGKVYVLADWTSGSAAALLTTLLQDNGLATIIGTPVANNPTGPSTYTPFKLPYTKARGSTASSYLSRPDSSKGKILQPDYQIEPCLQDYLQGIDPAWEKAIELIASEKQ